MEQKKIEIAYVITRFRASGPINQTYYIVKNLNKELFEASVISLFPEQEETKIGMFQELGIKIIQLNMGKADAILHGRKRVAKVLSQIQPDIIQPVGFPPYRMTLGYKGAVKVMTLRNYCYEDYPVKYGKLIGRPMAYMDQQFLKKQKAEGAIFVTCSSSLSKIYKKKMGIEFDYIKNGVDATRFGLRDNQKVVSLRKKLSIPPDKLVFVYSGKVNSRKNQVEAIEGFLRSRISSHAVLLLLGDGEKYEELRNKYNTHSNIIFRGNVTNIPDYLAASDIYVSTSKSEGLPNGVLEAMSIGLPVLLSDIPQHMEILDSSEGVGLFYSIGNLSSLSMQIDTIANSDIASMGKAAHISVIDNFTSEAMSERYQQLYKRIVYLER